MTDTLFDKQQKIQFVIKGKPQHQQRHRHCKCGSFIRTYDPSERDKKNFLAKARKHAPDKPFEGPLRMDIVCYFQRPKSHYGTGRNAGIVKPKYYSNLHTIAPDIDNLRKFVMDSLNKVFYRDDSQVCSGETHKRYGDYPRTEITITAI